MVIQHFCIVIIDCKNKKYRNKIEEFYAYYLIFFDISALIHLIYEWQIEQKNIFLQLQKYKINNTIENFSFIFTIKLKMKTIIDYGFVAHLREAIAINKSRYFVYSKVSGGKSRYISALLILVEIFALPIAFIFDKRAKKFNKKGIPIIVNDFVTMNNISTPHTLLKFTNRVQSADILEFSKSIKMFRTQISEYLKVKNLKMIVQLATLFLTYILDTETKLQTNFAMTKHIVESLLLIASNGAKYAHQSAGASFSITSDLIKLHLMTLFFAPSFDTEAQKLHSRGVGIVVNDLPAVHIHSQTV